LGAFQKDFLRGRHESYEEWVRVVGTRLEFGMKLATEHPRVVCDLEYVDELVVS
jgi:hypothetical protein